MKKIYRIKNGENFLILDTETLSIDMPLIYNIGWQIVDRRGIIKSRQSFLIEEVWKNQDLFKTAYYSSKKEFYEEQLRSGEITVNSYLAVVRLLWLDMHKHNISLLGAYNAKFDFEAIHFSNDYFYPEKEITKYLLGDKKLFDIWLNAGLVIYRKKEYKNFCLENNFLTKGGYIQGTAEVGYRYLINNPRFIENHTAIEDVEIETEIFQEVLKNTNGIITLGLQDFIFKVYN